MFRFDLGEEFVGGTAVYLALAAIGTWRDRGGDIRCSHELVTPFTSTAVLTSCKLVDDEGSIGGFRLIRASFLGLLLIIWH